VVNPFDLKTILLARHAQHVVLIHFPIALFMTGVGLDLFSRGKRNSQLAGAAYLNLSIAAATVLPTALTGLLAWQFALDGHKLKGMLLLHFVAALLATFLVIAAWWIHWCRKRQDIVATFPSWLPYSRRNAGRGSHRGYRSSRWIPERSQPMSLLITRE